MAVFKVVGVTKDNRQNIIKSIIDSYKAKGKLASWDGLTDTQLIEEDMDGYEFENQILKDVARLEKEPSNKHDPNAIKVLLKDAIGKWHQVGYVPKEQTGEISVLMKKLIRIDVEITGGRYKTVDFDDEDNEVIENDELTIGLLLHPVDVVEYTANNPFLKEGDGSTKTKILNRIGCGLMLFILLMIIIIIFT